MSANRLGMRPSIIAIVVAVATYWRAALPRMGRRRNRFEIGYAISLTGPDAAGAGITTLPNYRLWVKEVNAAGGIMLKSFGKRVPIEVIEYDDHSNVDDAMAAVERLIKRDKVDFILPPWGTGLNLAVGPLLHDAGYPHLAVTALTDKAPELGKRWPNSFWMLGTMTGAVKGLVGDTRQAARGRQDRQSDRDDERGRSIRHRACEGGAQGLQEERLRSCLRSVLCGRFKDLDKFMNEVKQREPDTFIAFSYPPGTIALTEQARALSFNPKIFYTAVGTAFPLYEKRFGGDAEGVMGIGGWAAHSPASKDYMKRHLAATGQEPDGWASPVTYASLQMLQQAIERVGQDRPRGDDRGIADRNVRNHPRPGQTEG